MRVFSVVSAVVCAVVAVVAGQVAYGPHPETYYFSEPNKVLLSTVDALVFHRGGWTAGRRSSPVAQMACTGWRCALMPPTMLCRNMGMDSVDVVWHCEGELPTDLRFADTVVSCEGYDYAEDPYVLAGSCGVSFRIELIPGRLPPVTYSDDYSAGFGVFAAVFYLMELLVWVTVTVFVLWLIYHVLSGAAHVAIFTYEPRLYNRWRNRYCGPGGYFPTYDEAYWDSWETVGVWPWRDPAIPNHPSVRRPRRYYPDYVPPPPTAPPAWTATAHAQTTRRGAPSAAPAPPPHRGRTVHRSNPFQRMRSSSQSRRTATTYASTHRR